MKNVIAGTAGHIDHGKTSLIKALTGIDADRLAEEKRRGITIDIGFAHLQLTPEIRIGFVDVPGHERFVKNMLAGAGGIDFVLLVVDAGESIKPQTREHFDICRLLGIQTGIIALTKVDQVDDDVLQLARMEVEEFAAGSFLADAPIVPVSAKTGRGIPELREALKSAAQRVTAKNINGNFRLPIDRAFSMKGFGTVVTGTLISGQVRPEQEVMLYPAGRLVRVRGIQVYGSSSDRAVAGERTAINLAGIEVGDASRGMVLAGPGRFDSVQQFDCMLEALPDAPPLKNRAPVHFHAGTAEIEAEVRLLGKSVLAAGARAYARMLLREPALLLPHDRFIIRRFSPVTTIGGGVVLDIGARRGGKEAPAWLAKVEIASRPEWIGMLVRASGNGLSPDQLVARTGLTIPEIDAAIRENESIVSLTGWFVDHAWLDTMRFTIIEHLRAAHRLDPLSDGVQKQQLRAGLPSAIFDALLIHPEIAVEGEFVRHRTHKVHLQKQEEEARAAIEGIFERAGLTVPALEDALGASGIDPRRTKILAQMLIRTGRLIRVTHDLVFHESALSKLKAGLAASKGARISVADFKERTGISRKYAIPLLEYLDRENITRREGDARVIL